MTKRTLKEMNAVCLRVGDALMPELEKHAGIGAILVVYELASVEVRDEDAIVAVTATSNAHIEKVLSSVLKTSAFVTAEKPRH